MHEIEFGVGVLKELILLLGKDLIFVSNKCCSFELSIYQKKSKPIKILIL